MATQKPISTISYNSEAFLKEHLDAWVDAHIIQAYQYIKHKGEDGDKDHIHVRVEPNKKLDQMDLTERLKEYVQGSEKPLGVRPWRPSKEEDWFLYSVHDSEYLKIKYGGGEKGEKIPYHYTDFVTSEGYDLEIAFTRAKAYMAHSSANLVKRLKSGEKAVSMVETGENPFMVGSMLRLLQTSDYERLQQACNELNQKLNMLALAIDKAGLFVYEKDGEYIISNDGCSHTIGEPVSFNMWNMRETEEEKAERRERKEELKRQRRIIEDKWKPVGEYFTFNIEEEEAE